MGRRLSWIPISLLSPARGAFARCFSSWTHLDETGCNVRMVDISLNSTSLRNARASGQVNFPDQVYLTVKKATMSGAAEPSSLGKGDLLTTAILAGIQGAKQTSSLIPLCHPLLLRNVAISYSWHDETAAIRFESSVSCEGPTGVEMEALTAVSVACLTIYDMTKALSKCITIGPIQLLSKVGGKSGDYASGAV